MTIQNSGRNDDNGICNKQNTGKQQGDQSSYKPGMSATTMYLTVGFVISGLKYCEMYF